MYVKGKKITNNNIMSADVRNISFMREGRARETLRSGGAYMAGGGAGTGNRPRSEDGEARRGNGTNGTTSPWPHYVPMAYCGAQQGTEMWVSGHRGDEGERR